MASKNDYVKRLFLSHQLLWLYLQSLLRIVPGVALYFGTIESMHVMLLNNNQGSPPGMLTNLLIGGFSRAFAATVMMPITVIKTRYEVKCTVDQLWIQNNWLSYTEQSISWCKHSRFSSKNMARSWNSRLTWCLFAKSILYSRSVQWNGSNRIEVISWDNMVEPVNITLRDAPFSGIYLMFYRQQLHLLSSGNHLIIITFYHL